MSSLSEKYLTQSTQVSCEPWYTLHCSVRALFSTEPWNSSCSKGLLNSLTWSFLWLWKALQLGGHLYFFIADLVGVWSLFISSRELWLCSPWRLHWLHRLIGWGHWGAHSINAACCLFPSRALLCLHWRGYVWVSLCLYGSIFVACHSCCGETNLFTVTL